MRIRVLGEPIAVKSGKKTAALKAWIERVRAESESRILPPGRYRVRLAFVLPRERYQAADLQNPHGKDLDNLVAPVLDGLSKAVLKEAGGDGAIVELVATKRAAREAEPPGVRITVSPR